MEKVNFEKYDHIYTVKKQYRIAACYMLQTGKGELEIEFLSISNNLIDGNQVLKDKFINFAKDCGDEIFNELEKFRKENNK